MFCLSFFTLSCKTKKTNFDTTDSKTSVLNDEKIQSEFKLISLVKEDASNLSVRLEIGSIDYVTKNDNKTFSSLQVVVYLNDTSLVPDYYKLCVKKSDVCVYENNKMLSTVEEVFSLEKGDYQVEITPCFDEEIALEPSRPCGAKTTAQATQKESSQGIDMSSLLTLRENEKAMVQIGEDIHKTFSSCAEVFKSVPEGDRNYKVNMDFATLLHNQAVYGPSKIIEVLSSPEIQAQVKESLSLQGLGTREENLEDLSLDQLEDEKGFGLAEDSDKPTTKEILQLPIFSALALLPFIPLNESKRRSVGGENPSQSVNNETAFKNTVSKIESINIQRAEGALEEAKSKVTNAKKILSEVSQELKEKLEKAPKQFNKVFSSKKPLDEQWIIVEETNTTSRKKTYKFYDSDKYREISLESGSGVTTKEEKSYNKIIQTLSENKDNTKIDILIGEKYVDKQSFLEFVKVKKAGIDAEKQVTNANEQVNDLRQKIKYPVKPEGTKSGVDTDKDVFKTQKAGNSFKQQGISSKVSVAQGLKWGLVASLLSVGIWASMELSGESSPQVCLGKISENFEAWQNLVDITSETRSSVISDFEDL